MHNRYLPSWLHRICNAVLGLLLVVTLGTLAVTKLLPGGVQLIAMFVVIASALMTTVVLLFVNPKRFSIVEGVAGDVGYDELTDEEPVDSTGLMAMNGQNVSPADSSR